MSLLILGVFAISAAVVWTFMGKVWVRFNGWVYRAKEPGYFWIEVTLYYLGGVAFIFLWLINLRR